MTNFDPDFVLKATEQPGAGLSSTDHRGIELPPLSVLVSIAYVVGILVSGLYFLLRVS